MRPAASLADPDRAAQGEAPQAERAGWLIAAARGLVAMTVIARLLTPTDGAAVGETIWVAQLALLALVVWGIAVFRSGMVRFEFDWVDGAVVLLVAGQIVGAICVLATEGDKRAAVTMLWEWCGLGATFFLARRLLSAPAERRSLLLAVAAAAVSLSALGLWQHYFGYAESRREYEQLKSQYQALTDAGRPADPGAARDWERSLQRVYAELMRMNIPGDPGAPLLWEQRLNSSEPFGMFALANTLAGCLVFSALIWLAALARSWRSEPKWQLALGAGATLIVLYCLLLTKSRTAFAGLLAGLGAWGVAELVRGRRQESGGRGQEAGGSGQEAGGGRRWGVIVGAGVVGVAALVGLAAATGGLDRFVVSESMKSLRYRFEYWQGTFQMLTADPHTALLGVGPGNFRQHYLQFKLPRSSEEIADPHDLFLDVWANGGVLSLAGLVGLCVAGCRALWRGGQSESAEHGDPHLPATAGPVQTEAGPKQGHQKQGHQKQGQQREGRAPGRGDSGSGAPGLAARPRFLGPAANAVLAGGALAHLAILVPGGAPSETIWLLLLGWLCVVAACRGLFSRDLPAAARAGAFIALGVHLVGAGGIAMPAIAQLLLLAVICGTAAERPRAWTKSLESRLGGAVVALATLAIYFGCWFTGLAPIVAVRAAMAAGKEELYEEHRPDLAQRHFRRAIEADPFASEPYQLLSQMAFQQWLRGEGGSSKEFDRAVALQRDSIARDPRLPAGHRTLGEMHLARFTRSGDLADAAEAAEAFGRAVELYPNSALGQAELAEAFFKGGLAEPARAAATRALELDDINAEAGHIDKRLSAERRETIKEIAGGK